MYIRFSVKKFMHDCLHVRELLSTAMYPVLLELLIGYIVEIFLNFFI